MGHDHDHGASTAANRTRLTIAFAITASILVAEVIGAFATGSLALLVDAGHMLTDAGGLLMAVIAANLVLKPASDRFTWGFRRAEVLAALAQASILFAVGIYAFIEGIKRLLDPPEVSSAGLLVFGIIGLVGNIASILILSSGRGANLNMRAAFLEVVNDALGSVAVIVSAIVIALTGWTQIDAIAAMLISALIIPRTIKLIIESGGILLESTPKGLDLTEVRARLLDVPHVTDVHDLHASQIATGLPVITAHVVVESSCFSDGHAPEILGELQRCVAEQFTVNVEHSTFQIEPEGFRASEVSAHP